MPSASEFRVLLTDRAWPDTDIERGILAAAGAELIEAPDTREATLRALAADADAIAANWAPVTEAVVRAAQKCRVISRTGIGLDNISVATATELKIPVTNVPDYCVGEVADHALALILACARNIAWFHLETKRGEYQLQAAPPMPRLAGKTLGLIGLGRIGRNLCGKAQALGLRTIAHTASGNDHGTGCRMVTLDELLAGSDFVSLHAPLVPATRHLLGLAQFEGMQRSAYLINTARGGLIDQAALATALERNLIAGAGLDVFEPEPPDLSSPLLRDERVIVTPHAGFVSVESLIELRTRVARQIADVLAGRRPECVVNPEIYASGPAV
jgi:D-3-phosphoglycerate dehydrogenase